MGTSMTETENIPTGPAWAAILSAGFGCLSFGILVDLAEASPKISIALNFHNPTGDLSGKSTIAVAIWLITWFILHMIWKKQTPKSPGACSPP